MELIDVIKSLLPEDKRNVSLFIEGEYTLVGYYPKNNSISEKLPDFVVKELNILYPIGGDVYVFDVPVVKRDEVTGKRMQMTKIWVKQ